MRRMEEMKMQREKRFPDNNDACLKYYELILEQKNVSNIPVAPLPDGYRFVYYRPGDKKDWIAIEMSAREFVLEEEGEMAWKNYYGGREEELTDRMLFIEDSSGEKVATATAFYDSRDTSGAGWLHWVAVKRTQQGKGLARPLISKALHRLTELGYTDIKVPTQTNTWVAAKLYLDAGFIPEEKNAVCSRDGYRILKTLTGHPTLEGIEPLPFEDIWDQEMLLTEKKLRDNMPDLLYFKAEEWKGKRRVLYCTEKNRGILEIDK